MVAAEGERTDRGEVAGEQYVVLFPSVPFTSSTDPLADKALIRSNVQLGGEVALEYAKLLKEEV